MTNLEALQLLYNASEAAPLTGPDRNRVRAAAKQIELALLPPEEKPAVPPAAKPAAKPAKPKG